MRENTEAFPSRRPEIARQILGYDFAFGGVAGVYSDGVRALSIAELQELAIKQAEAMRGVQPSLYQLLGMANYQPPVDKKALDARYAKFCADLDAFKNRSAPAA